MCPSVSEDDMITQQELTADEHVKRRILDEIHWGNEIRSTDIGVEVEGGIVTLLGAVDSYHKKWMAEQAALGVDGVRGVANELSVRDRISQQPADAAIARATLNLLDWSPAVPAGQVKVGVADGSVVLEGTV